MVTAGVNARDYNDLRLGDPVRFRVAGTSREYAGRITKLGLTSTGGSFAIAPEEHHYQLAVSLPDLAGNPDDSCAIGRTGQVIFEGAAAGGMTRFTVMLRHSLGLS